MVWWSNHQWESSGPKILESQSLLLPNVIFKLRMEYRHMEYGTLISKRVMSILEVAIHL
jgi:hypothetical protein